MLCGLGGILSCGITHTLVVPLDLVKCRLQVDSAKYKTVFNGFKVLYTLVDQTTLNISYYYYARLGLEAGQLGG